MLNGEVILELGPCVFVLGRAKLTEQYPCRIIRDFLHTPAVQVELEQLSVQREVGPELRIVTKEDLKSISRPLHEVSLYWTDGKLTLVRQMQAALLIFEKIIAVRVAVGQNPSAHERLRLYLQLVHPFQRCHDVSLLCK